MDVTTVNDRHLYRATVVLRDAHDPTGQVELPGLVVRFGPPGRGGASPGWRVIAYRGVRSLLCLCFVPERRQSSLPDVPLGPAGRCGDPGPALAGLEHPSTE